VARIVGSCDGFFDCHNGGAAELLFCDGRFVDPIPKVPGPLMRKPFVVISATLDLSIRCLVRLLQALNVVRDQVR